MRERDLYPPVRKWLEAQGYTVYVERFDCDVIGVRGEELCVVELKLNMSSGLISQLRARAQWAHFVYCAVPESLKLIRLPHCRSGGFGVLTVQGDKITRKLKAKPQPLHTMRRRLYRLKVLGGMESAQDYHCAGLPCGPDLKAMNDRRYGRVKQA